MTFLGVEPNDKLTFGAFHGFAQTPPSTGNLSFSAPCVAGANYYYAYTGCGEAYSPTCSPATGQLSFGTVTLNATCAHSSFPVQFIAYGPSGVMNVGSTTIGTPSAGATASISFWQQPTQIQLNSTGLADELTSVNAYEQTIGDGRQLPVLDGHGRLADGERLQHDVHDGDGRRSHARVVLHVSQRRFLATPSIYDGLSAFATSWTVASPKLPPWITGVVAPGGANLISWYPVTTAATVTASAMVVSVSWNKSIEVSGTATNANYTWSFIVPPSATSISFPALPAALATLAPTASDYLNPTVQSILIPNVADYNAVRAIPERDLTCASCAVANGDYPRIIVDQYFNDEDR